MERRRKVTLLQLGIYRRLPYLRGPLIGFVVDFWTSLIEEGVMETVKPRWGMVTFAYLNDGIKPSLWHTYMQVMDPTGPYSAIYVSGAPKNRKEADARR